MRVVGSIVAVLVFAGLTFLAVRFFLDNQIGRTNRLTREAGEDYRNREYVGAFQKYRQLIDSLQYANDAATLNYANAGYLSSSILDQGLKGARQQQPLSDTLVQQMVGNSISRFNTLIVSTNKEIASSAYNQLGYISVRNNKPGESGEGSDSLLVIALENFKMALRRNPDNDSARYNYELLKKTVGFAETIVSQAKSLVAQQRYMEAAKLLETSMQRDARLMKQRDFLNRIKSIAGIDTTYRSTRR